MNKLLYFIVVFILFFLVSCSESSKNSKPITKTKRELYRSALTRQDSILSRKVVATFLTYVQNEKYADAVMMLHKLNSDDPYATPELLDNNEIEKTMMMLKQFKIQSYAIASIVYESAVNNPTRCTVFVKNGDDNPIRTTIELNPINYLGEWKLCFPMTRD